MSVIKRPNVVRIERLPHTDDNIIIINHHRHHHEQLSMITFCRLIYLSTCLCSVVSVIQIQTFAAIRRRVEVLKPVRYTFYNYCTPPPHPLLSLPSCKMRFHIPAPVGIATTTCWLVVVVVVALLISPGSAITEEDEGVRYADRCEACKILAIELQDRLTETGRSHDVIELG